MRAAFYSEYGDSSVIQVGELPDPEIAPDEILVRSVATSVNPVDWMLRSGALQNVFPVTFPKVPGCDVAGTVERVGADVAGVDIGDSVFGSTGDRASAELVALRAWAPLPAGWDPIQAAAIGSVGYTAVRALDDLGVEAGKTLLIEGGAGGVGSVAVQLAVALGARVIATARDENHEYLESIGAIPVQYGEGLAERVAAITDRVDLVFDTAGSGSLPDLIAIAGDPTRVLSIADPRAPAYGARLERGEKDDPQPRLLALAEEMARGTVRVRIAATYSLAHLGAAHDLSASGHAPGKVAVDLTAGDTGEGAVSSRSDSVRNSSSVYTWSGGSTYH